MSRAHTTALVAATCLVSVYTGPALAVGPIPNTPAPGQFAVPVVRASGMVAPVGMAVDPTNTGRYFIWDQAGQVRVYQGGSLLAAPALDLVATSKLIPLSAGYDERGLLGFAFDPGFANAASPGYQRVWTYYTAPVANAARPSDYTIPFPGTTLNNQGVVASFKIDPADPTKILPGTENAILRLDHPSLNHDGGSIGFGPDGNLYVGIGDGGGANDRGNGHNPYTPPGATQNVGNAQDTSIFMGKILRLDVNGTNAPNGKYGIPADNPFATTNDANNPGQDPSLPTRPSQKEIYAWGVRNPFNFHFSDGRLLLGEVGQNNVEEIDEVFKGKNYGWHQLEGTFVFNALSPGTVATDTGNAVANSIPNYVGPLKQYDHDEGVAVLGGFIYHGTQFPQLVGKYVFGDFGKSTSLQDAGPNQTGRIFYADLADGQVNQFNEFTLAGGTLNQIIKGMAEGPNGEIYLLTSLKLGPSTAFTTGMMVELVAPEPSSVALLGLGAVGLLRRTRRSMAT